MSSSRRTLLSPLPSPAGVRELSAATMDLGYGGSRPGHASAFVLRPDAGLALSNLAKAILDDFE